MQRLPLTLPLAAWTVGLAVGAHAQALGTVKTQTARVQGVVSVSAGTATIQNNATVTAGRENVDVTLTRGGTVRVCLGSTVALSQANSAVAVSQRPLLLALQRGATEVNTSLLKTDAVITPDLRIESSDAAAIDLRLRVNEVGDTCVENLGKNAPILHVTEQLSGAGYLVKPGQHIIFEKGSVRAVVNRATTQCGCPRPGNPKDDFPVAESAGLVPEHVPAAPQGDAHVQVSAGIDYNGKTGTVSGPPQPDGSVPTTTAPGAAAAQAPAAQPKPAQTSEGSHNPFSAIGRFFKRLFGGGA